MVPFQLCRDSVDTGPGPFVLDGSEMPLRASPPATTDSATDTTSVLRSLPYIHK